MSAGWRDVGFFLRGRLNETVSRIRTTLTAAPPVVPAPLAEALRGGPTPAALVPLLEGRSNAEREAAVAAYLEAHGIPFTRHRFGSFEGQGENFAVDVGGGDRVLVLVAHHDAVPGSPGANDNAAAVGILLHLLDGLPAALPPRLRVRLLFTAAEERGYLGARAYARDTSLEGIVGVVSLELCGVGDTPVVWDVDADTPFARAIGGALEGLGLHRDEGWHAIGRIPVFGSDHRAFAAAGVPGYGLSIVPAAEAERLRRFIENPLRGVFKQLAHRPRPFDTYHTPRDRAETLDRGALDLVVRILRALVGELG